MNPATITLGSGGTFSVASNSAFAAASSSTINAASAASVLVQGNINVTNGSTLTINLPAVNSAINTANYPSLLAWYSASSLSSTLTNGQAVTTWTDLSGNGRTANTPSNTSTFLTNQSNGLPAVLFNNSHLTISGHGLFGRRGVRRLQVRLHHQQPRHLRQRLDHRPSGAATSTGWMLQGNNTNFWNDGNRIPQAVSENGTAVSANNPFPLSNVGNYMVMKVDTNNYEVTHTATTGYYLGWNGGWGNGLLDVAEILVFSSKLTAAQEENVGGYLTAEVRHQHGLHRRHRALALGNLSLAPATSLLLGGSSTASFSSITAGNGTTIQGNVTLNGAFATSASPGTLNVTGNFAMGSGSSYTWGSLGSGAGQSDTIAVTGNLDLTGPWTLTTNPLAPLPTGNYPVFTYTGTLTNPGSPNHRQRHQRLQRPRRELFPHHHRRQPQRGGPPRRLEPVHPFHDHGRLEQFGELE